MQSNCIHILKNKHIQKHTHEIGDPTRIISNNLLNDFKQIPWRHSIENQNGSKVVINLGNVGQKNIKNKLQNEFHKEFNSVKI